MGIKEFRKKNHLSWNQVKPALVASVVGIGVATTGFYYGFTAPQNKELERLHEMVKPQNEFVAIENEPLVKECELYYSPKKDEDLFFSLPREYFVMLKNHERSVSTSVDIAYYMIHDTLIEKIAQNITSAPDSYFLPFGQEKLPDYMKIMQFMRANIMYTEDKGLGYAKFPLETLIEKKGDCEDMAILASSLLRAVGRDVALVKDYALANNDPMFKLMTADFMPYSTELEGRGGHVTLAIALKDDELMIPCINKRTMGTDKIEQDFPAQFNKLSKRYIVLDTTSKSDKFFMSEIRDQASIIILP